MEKETKYGLSEKRKKFGIELEKGEQVSEDTYIELSEGKGEEDDE